MNAKQWYQRDHHAHHDHSHQHDHHAPHDHSHQHDHHAPHDHSHQHDQHAHHDHSHQHGQHAHHDHSHQHDHHAHHDHSHQHDHHSHHDHSNQHDHHDHNHQLDPHALESLLPSSAVGMQSDGTVLQKKQHRHIDHNMEGIFLHVLADTLGSVGVVLSTLLIKYKGWLVADPACSIFISVLIVSSVIPLLRNSAEILLQRVPRVHEQDLKEAVNDVMKIRGVRSIQNLHVWSFTNTEVVGTLHLHVSAETDKASTKAQVSHLLHDAGVKDLTMQVECIKN